ncbi:MAG: hypothetical protein ABWX96_16070 [Propionibacteriaceae bacterium]
MSKGKASKDKAARADKSAKGKSSKAQPSKKERKAKKSGGAAPEATVSGAPAAAPELGSRPPGQRLYDMPYSALAPRMIKPEIGLHNLVTRAGHNAGYTIDVTLLDAPDHRLIRSGVLLAHRVLDGRGEWYLSATDWQPMLPKEQIEPMGQADLSEAFADLVRPFRRRATLGPVAALNCERREFALRDDRGHTMALLRDDKVTVRRGGLTTARYREVMVTPTGPGLTEEQQTHVERALANAGATQVSKFPRLVTRLGAPATGPTDFPTPSSLEQDTSFTQFVSHLLGTRLREILSADLAVRTGDPGAAAQLAARCAQLRAELRGLSSVIDVSWIEDLDEELEWIVSQAEQEVERQNAPGDPASGDLKDRLRGERYLTLLDRLVTATRAPQVGNVGTIQASEVLGSLVSVGQTAVAKASARLTAESPPEAWAAATNAYDGLFQVTGVASYLLPERVERLRHQLGVSTQLLAEATKHDDAAQRSRELAAKSSAEEAFALGRAYAYELTVARKAREAFVRRWAKTAKKLE